MQAYFEPVPHDDSCAYCSGRRVTAPLPAPLAAVYCISLQEQPHRTAAAAAHLHHRGLCRHVTLYRPARGRNSTRAIWESHRALARHALANGREHVLILEDDVFFRDPWAALAPRIGSALARLPDDWSVLYLGHVPLQAYFVRPGLLRVRSFTTHAYLAGPRMLRWLVDNGPSSPDVVPLPFAGYGIDAAMANLPGMYAMFPMAARQRFLGDRRIDPRLDHTGRLRSWRDRDRWRDWLLFRGAYAAEAAAAALSPFHRLTLERYRARCQASTAEQARLIRGAGLFDDAFYERYRPDVAERVFNALWHYLLDGARERVWPCPLFDPNYYAAQSPDLGRENPLVHFIRVGSALRRNPHPLFDTAFYMARYAAEIPSGANPLGHFLATGGVAGFDPHPLFDTAWYLSRHPQLRQRRQNPLVHYLTEGWRAGAAPHPQFDGELYLQSHADVKAAGVNPLEHFVRYGRAEGRPQPIPGDVASRPGPRTSQAAPA
jgi:GR25 family glycosyltransferase involved in LPS biosynthesis